MFDISFGELLLIAVVALIVLGPERLPKVAHWIGKTFATWKRFSTHARAQFEQDIQWDDLKDLHHTVHDTLTESLSTLQHSVQTSVSSNYNASLSDSLSSSQDALPMTSSAVDNLLSSDPTQDHPPLIGVVMGSTSDWKVMKQAARILKEFGIPFEAKVVSAHRMPDAMFMYAATARQRGLKAIIAGAGGAAHLPGMLAAKTTLPVLGVPIPATQLNGQDALYSIVQMPKGIPVATFAIGEPGAANAALFAASLLANESPALVEHLEKFRRTQTATVANAVLDVDDL